MGRLHPLRPASPGLRPADGVLATANARVTPDGYRYPITLNWMAPYRTERIYKVLEASQLPNRAQKSALRLDRAERLRPS